ncbi:MAG: DUF2278 family protein [Formosimonas sp.]
MSKSSVVAALWASLLVSQYGFAALSDYGVVVGTVVYDNIVDIAKTQSPHLEPQKAEGKYPHYIFNVDSPNGRYQCAIDIFSRQNAGGAQQSIRYRIVPLNMSAPEWSKVLNLSNGYHQMPNNADSAALDYVRHLGINKDAQTSAWVSDANFVVGTQLPAFDNLFKNVKRVWVFGQPFTKGLGMHNIHQNQGNVPSYVLQSPQGATGEDHSKANGIWQDGGVIFEYAPIRKWRVKFHSCQTGRCKMRGQWVWVPNRKLLMTQFQVQGDFTLDKDGTMDGYSLKAGDGYPPLVIYDYSLSANNQTIQVGGAPMEGQHSSVAGVSKKIRILLTPTSGHPVLYGRIGAPPTQSLYDAKSDQPVGKTETIHSYSNSAQKWYWRVFNEGSTPAVFNWEEFDADD